MIDTKRMTIHSVANGVLAGLITWLQTHDQTASILTAIAVASGAAFTFRADPKKPRS